jgi:predicted branched-subunit amino acid permease
MASHHSLSRNHVQAPVRKIRVTTTAIVVLLTLVALVFSDIVDLSIFAGGLSVSLSAAMLYLLLGKVNRGRFNGSVFGGLIGLAVGLFFFGFEPVILLVVLAGTLLGLLYRKK